MDYQDKLLSELRRFQDLDQIHDLPDSFHYVSCKYLQPLVEAYFGVSRFDQLVVKGVRTIAQSKPESEIRVLSLGSGNCDYEINMASTARLRCRIVCMELNQTMLDRGLKLARSKGMVQAVEFVQADINTLQLPGRFDIIMANHALHHFVELEHILAEIERAMRPESFFFVNDMIGRNGHLFWDNTLDLVNRLWRSLPQDMKYHHQLKSFFVERKQWDCSTEGLEGVRAQDILPLLDQRLKFLEFLPFFSLMNGFIDRGCGHNFKVDRPMDRSFLDWAYSLDEYCLREHYLKPTQMMATLARTDSPRPVRKGLFFDTPVDIYHLDDDKYRHYFMSGSPASAAATSQELSPSE